MARAAPLLSLLPAAHAAGNKTVGSAAGGWAIVAEEVALVGQVCGVLQTAHLYYPQPGQQPGKYPLLAFSHGMDAGGPLVSTFYKGLLEGVAASGYVVVAHESGTADVCFKENRDQLLALAWAWNTWTGADAYIDKSKKVGIFGHSMGGGATFLNAIDAAAVKEYNIGAAAILHPYDPAHPTLCSNPLLPYPPLAPADAGAVVPSLFFTGSMDVVVCTGPPTAMYARTKGVPKLLANIRGAGHNECGTGSPERETVPVALFFGCHLWDNQDGCRLTYGANATECDLCHCRNIPMAACEMENSPVAG